MKDSLTENHQKENEGVDDRQSVSRWFFLAFGIGFALVVIGISVVVLSAVLAGGSASTSVVIFIGPFPIVFGTGHSSELLILIGAILAIISVILFIVMRRK